MPSNNAVNRYIEDVREWAKVDKGGTNCYFISGATTSSEVTGSTETTANTFGKIMFLSNCHITSITSTQISGSTDWTTDSTIVAGTELIAKITKLKTKVGKMLVYLYST